MARSTKPKRRGEHPRKKSVNAKAAQTPSRRQRAPRVLWANSYCMLDTSSGASISVRQILMALSRAGYEIEVVGATIFDDAKGASTIYDSDKYRSSQLGDAFVLEDTKFKHFLVKTKSAVRSQMTHEEIGKLYHLYIQRLDSFKPDLVFFYGGQVSDLLIPLEARVRGIPSAAYLVNANYQSRRWCRDVDLIITDTQATSDFYFEKQGFRPVPVGKFIDPASVIAPKHTRKHATLINPNFAKGAGVVAMLALHLEKTRPDITFEVVESRGNWQSVVASVTNTLEGAPRNALSNVVVTPNTANISEVYARSRVVLGLSQWWESGSRVLAEAMLNGVPAIVSNHGGSPEMVGDGGIVVDLPDVCHQPPYNRLPRPELLEPIAGFIEQIWDDEALYLHLMMRALQQGTKQHRIEVSTQRLLKVFEPLVSKRSGDNDYSDVLRSQHKHQLLEGSVPLTTEQEKVQRPLSFDERLAALPSSKAIDAPGGVRWFVQREQYYGGFVSGVRRGKISKHEPESSFQLRHGHIGGDRMSLNRHAYSLVYSPFLRRFLEKTEKPLLLEVGILKGTGLAIWSELFPDSRLIGCDLDPSIFNENFDRLLALGAFSRAPEIVEMDQYNVNSGDIERIVSGEKISIFIDDGAHTDEAILNTLRAVMPHLARDFVCFIEDNSTAFAAIKDMMSDHNVFRFGEMTVVSAGNVDVSEAPFWPEEFLERASRLETDGRRGDNIRSNVNSARESLVGLSGGGREAQRQKNSPDRIFGLGKSYLGGRHIGELKISSTREMVALYGEFYEESRRTLSDWMNVTHGMKESYRYWEIVLHYFFVHWLFCERFLYAWNTGGVHRGPSKDMVAANFPTLTSRQYHFTMLKSGSGFNPFFEDNLIPEAAPGAVVNVLPEARGQFLDFFATSSRLVSFRDAREDFILDLGVQNIAAWQDKFKDSRQNIVRLASCPFEWTNSPNWRMRADLADLDNSKPICGIRGFWKALAFCFPMEFLENFRSLRNLVNFTFSELTPKAVAGSILSTIFSRIVAAESVSRGIPLILHQHGGGYGVNPHHLASQVEPRIADIFYTWGWCREGEDNIIPFKPVRFEGLVDEYRALSKDKSEILLLGRNRGAGGGLLDGTDLWQDSTDRLVDYYLGLSAAERARCVYRPRKNHGVDEKEELAIIERLDGIKVDFEGRTIAQAYACAERVVCEYAHSTSEWECAALNIPFRCISPDPDTYLEFPLILPSSYDRRPL